MEVVELKKLHFSLGVMRLDKIKNEYIRGTLHICRFNDKVREVRLRWFGYVKQTFDEYVRRRMLEMDLHGRRKRGRLKRRFLCANIHICICVYMYLCVLVYI